MTDWLAQTERKIEMITNEISFLSSKADEMNMEPSQVCEPLFKKLRDIYLYDYPLAKTRDNSDLLLHIEGKGVEFDPKLSLVSSLFSNVRFQVRDLTKAIANISALEPLLPKHVDLELAGIAKGSLFVGFKAPESIFYQGKESIFGDDDPLLVATKAALKTLNVVSHEVSDTDGITESEELSSVIDDPKIRDAGLLAVKRISPSSRSNIDVVSVTGRNDFGRPAHLTSDVRKSINSALKKPMDSQEVDSFFGQIREIDLDAKRFELRGIADQELQSIRCIYTNLENFEPKRMLDTSVRVTGTVARDKNGRPRLLSITKLESRTG